MQLELPGIKPLTYVEQAALSISQLAAIDSQQAAEAMLVIEDDESRSSRGERALWAQAERQQFGSGDRLIPGGEEAFWLYNESIASFINGSFLAAVVCAHASCERVLGGCLELYENQIDKHWRRWGLGRLIREAERLDLINAPLRCSHQSG